MIKKVKLGDICDIYSAGDKPNIFSEVETEELNIPVYGNGRDNEGLVGYTDKAGFLSKAVTVAARGSSCGVAFYRTKPYMPIVRLLSLVAKPDIDTKYLYYQVCNRHFKGTGSGQPQITIPDIANAPIHLETELEIQEKIGEALFTLDEKITNNNSICSDLKSMAKLLYDYWFVQFDFPDENGRPYKSSGGKMVWNEELKREIPEGWEAGSISDLGKVIGGATPSTKNKDYYVEHGIGWITPNDLSNTSNKYIAHGERDITEEAVASCSTIIMPRGTVLMSSRAPIGYLAIASDDVCTNQGFKSIIPHEYSSEFIYQTLSIMMPYIKNFGVGSTFAEVSKDELSNMRILLPNRYVEQQYTKKTKSICEQIELLESENQQLASLRDFLLPMLMNGQVKVADKTSEE